MIGTNNYTVDETGQLTSASLYGEDYDYDSNGNRTSTASSTYKTGADNRILSDGTYRYLYDKAGNRTAKFVDNNSNGKLDSGDTDITLYSYDYRNRLIDIVMGSVYGGSATKEFKFTYDYKNRKIRESYDADGAGSAPLPMIIWSGKATIRSYSFTTRTGWAARRTAWRIRIFICTLPRTK